MIDDTGRRLTNLLADAVPQPPHAITAEQVWAGSRGPHRKAAMLVAVAVVLACVGVVIAIRAASTHRNDPPATSMPVLIPPGSSSLLIRSLGDALRGGRTIRVQLHSGYDHLIAELNAGVGHLPRVKSCNGGGLQRDYELRFSYPSRPGVRVDINPDCTPSITTGKVRTDNIAVVIPIVRDLAGLHGNEP